MSKNLTWDGMLAKFRVILPELPPISTAPTGPAAEPSFHAIKTGAERDAFVELWYSREAEKRYKAIDKSGMVYKVQNPCIAHYINRDHKAGIEYRAKERLGHIEELSLGSSSSREDGAW